MVLLVRGSVSIQNNVASDVGVLVPTQNWLPCYGDLSVSDTLHSHRAGRFIWNCAKRNIHLVLVVYGPSPPEEGIFIGCLANPAVPSMHWLVHIPSTCS